MRSSLSILTVALWLSAISVSAQEGAKVSTAEDATAKIDRLIGELRSPEFSVRQSATAALLKLDAIESGILDQKSRSLEEPEASAVRQIVVRLRKRLYDDRLAELVKAPTVEAAAKLPEWTRFAEIVGQDEKSLDVFIEMLQVEKDLFAMRLFASPELSGLMESRSREFSKLCNGRRDVPFPVATCAALMLLGSDSTLDLQRLTSTQISDAFSDPRFGELVDEGVYAPCLRRLAGAWMNRTSKTGRPAIAVDRPLLFAIEHDLEEGRTLALKSIQTGAKFQSMAYSLLCIAKFRNADDLKVVEPLLESGTTLWPLANQKNKQLPTDPTNTYSIQIRDVALVVASYLRQRNPADFGSAAQPSDATVFDFYSLGFEREEDRTAAIAKYRMAYP